MNCSVIKFTLIRNVIQLIQPDYYSVLVVLQMEEIKINSVISPESH